MSRSTPPEDRPRPRRSPGSAGRRWFVRILAGVVLVLACVRLGMWQLDRADERADRNAVFESSLAADPVPVDEALSTDASPATADEWRTVEVRGRYDADGQLLLRLRPVDGQTGAHVITPLVTADGTTLLVDRGFVPSAGASLPEVSGPPTAEVEVTARVRLPESGEGTGGDPASGAIRYMDVEALEDFVGAPTYRAWAELVTEEPGSPDAPTPIAPPEIESGPHLSYAIQWFLFAATGIVGFILLIRSERRSPRDDHEPAATQRRPDGRGADADPDGRETYGAVGIEDPAGAWSGVGGEERAGGRGRVLDPDRDPQPTDPRQRSIG